GRGRRGDCRRPGAVGEGPRRRRTVATARGPGRALGGPVGETSRGERPLGPGQGTARRGRGDRKGLGPVARTTRGAASSTDSRRAEAAAGRVATGGSRAEPGSRDFDPRTSGAGRRRGTDPAEARATATGPQ